MKKGPKKSVYLSGAITKIGVKEARKVFKRWAAILKGKGLKVYNPMENGLDADAPYELHMAADLEMIKACDTIVMLPGWEESDGARRERDAAEKLKKSIVIIK